MNPETLAALQASIAKWRRVCLNPSEVQEDCPLCDLFRKIGCDGCPVFTRTRYPYCLATPYIAWYFDHSPIHALAELRFLESLLP